MNLDQFCEVCRSRIPTPAEFVAFVQGQRWGFAVDGEKASLVGVPPADMDFAKAVAKMLGREPYRTNVLAELKANPSGQAAERAIVGERPAPRSEQCRSCGAMVTDRTAAASVCGTEGPVSPTALFRFPNPRCPYRSTRSES